jgi:hypothetical protein
MEASRAVGEIVDAGRRSVNGIKRVRQTHKFFCAKRLRAILYQNAFSTSDFAVYLSTGVSKLIITFVSL